MKDKDFRALLDLMMCCDPWPINDMADPSNAKIIKDMLLLGSVKRNYPNWIDAYHNFEGGES